MTVAEVILELQKFPAHWTVLIEHPDGRTVSDSDVASIAAIRDGTDNSHNTVVLDATKGVL